MDTEDGNWFESESFWVEMFPFMFPETRFAAAVENVPKIASLTGVGAGSMLDLACGPGHYAIPLAQAGYRGDGRRPHAQFLLDAARERAARAGTDVESIEADMRNFARPTAFDLAISMGSHRSAISTTRRRIAACSRTVRTSLKPGGAFFCWITLARNCWPRRFQPTRFGIAPRRHALGVAPANGHRRLVAHRWRMDPARGGPCHDVPPPALALLGLARSAISSRASASPTFRSMDLWTGLRMARRRSGLWSSAQTSFLNRRLRRFGLAQGRFERRRAKTEPCQSPSTRPGVERAAKIGNRRPARLATVDRAAPATRSGSVRSPRRRRVASRKSRRLASSTTDRCADFVAVRAMSRPAPIPADDAGAVNAAPRPSVV